MKTKFNSPAKFDVDILTAFRVKVNATAEGTSEANNDINGGLKGSACNQKSDQKIIEFDKSKFIYSTQKLLFLQMKLSDRTYGTR